jgi:hypothetical protein
MQPALTQARFADVSFYYFPRLYTPSLHFQSLSILYDGTSSDASLDGPGREGGKVLLGPMGEKLRHVVVFHPLDLYTNII